MGWKGRSMAEKITPETIEQTPDVTADDVLDPDAILAELAAARGIAFVDVHDLSLRVATEPGLVAGDGLHPSGAQYALWVERIAPVVARLIGRGR